MADLDKNFSLEDALTDNPPEIEAEIKRDFISTLEAEPYDDVVGETCGKSDYVPLLDDDAAKSGDQEHKNKSKKDGTHVERSSRVSGNETLFSEFHSLKEPWQLEQDLCFEPQPIFQPVQDPEPFEAKQQHNLLSEVVLLPSCETKARPAFTEHFGSCKEVPEAVTIPEMPFFNELSSDPLFTGTTGGIPPQLLGETAAPTNNAAYEDDWLRVDRHPEAACDFEDISDKKADTPGEALSKHSPWKAPSFPVEMMTDDHTGSHWQPTIQEQHVLGTHHLSEPSRTAEFTLLEGSSAPVTLAEVSPAAEFTDWQHADPRVSMNPADILKYNEKVPESLTFEATTVPEPNAFVEDEYLLQSSPKSCIGAGMSDNVFVSQQRHELQQELQEETSEIKEAQEFEKELSFDAVAVPVKHDAPENESFSQQNSEPDNIFAVFGSCGPASALEINDTSSQQILDKETIPVVLVALAAESSLETEIPEDKCSSQDNSDQESPLEVLGFQVATTLLGKEIPKDESLSLQDSDKQSVSEVLEPHATLEVPEETSSRNSNNESISDIFGYDPAAVKFVFGEASLPLQNSKSGGILEVLELDAATVPVTTGTVEDECSSQQVSFPQQEPLEEHTESTDMLEDKETVPISLSIDAVAIPVTHEVADDECLPGQNSIHDVLGLDAASSPLGIEVTRLSQQYESKEVASAVAGFEEVASSLSVEDMTLSHQKLNKESFPEDIEYNPATVHLGAETLRDEPLPYQNPEHHKDLEEIETAHHESSPKPKSEFHEHLHSADILIESNINFAEARAPADGACTMEEEKYTEDLSHDIHLKVEPAEGNLDELNLNAPGAAAAQAVEGHKPGAEPCDFQHTQEPCLEASAPVKQVFIPSDHASNRTKTTVCPIADPTGQLPIGLSQKNADDPPMVAESRSSTRSASRTKALHKKAAELMETKRESGQDEWTPESGPAVMKKKKKKPKQKKTLQSKSVEGFAGNAADSEVPYITSTDFQKIDPIKHTDEKKSVKGCASMETSHILGQPNTGSDDPSILVEQPILISPLQHILETNKVLIPAQGSSVLEKAMKGEERQDSDSLLLSERKPKMIPVEILDSKPGIRELAVQGLAPIVTTPNETFFRNKSKKLSELKDSATKSNKKETLTGVVLQTEDQMFLGSTVQLTEQAHVQSVALKEGKHAELLTDPEGPSLEQPMLIESTVSVPVVPSTQNNTNICIELKADYSCPDFTAEYLKDKDKAQGPNGTQRSDKAKKSRNTDRRKKAERLLERPDMFENKTAGGKGQTSPVMPLKANAESSGYPYKSSKANTFLADQQLENNTWKERCDVSYAESVVPYECKQPDSEVVSSKPLIMEKKDKVKRKIPSLASANEPPKVNSVATEHKEAGTFCSGPKVHVEEADLIQVEVISQAVESRADQVHTKVPSQPVIPIETTESQFHVPLPLEPALTVASKLELVDTKVDTVQVHLLPETALAAESKEVTQKVMMSSEPSVHFKSKPENSKDVVFLKLPITAESKNDIAQVCVSDVPPGPVNSSKHGAWVQEPFVCPVLENKGDAQVSLESVDSRRNVSSELALNIEINAGTVDVQATGASSRPDKEQSVLGSKKAGRGSLKRDKGAKTASVAHSDDKDNSHAHKNREGKVTTSKNSPCISVKAHVPTAPTVQDSLERAGIFGDVKGPTPGSLDPLENATVVASVAQFQDKLKEAAIISAIQDIECNSTKQLADLDIQAGEASMSSVSDQAKGSRYVEVTLIDGCISSLPLNTVESKKSTDDQAKGKSTVQLINSNVSDVFAVSPFSLESIAEVLDVLSAPQNEKKEKTSLDEVKPVETSRDKSSAWLGSDSVMEKYPNVSRLEEHSTSHLPTDEVKIISNDPVAVVETKAIEESPILADKKTESLVCLDINEGAVNTAAEKNDARSIVDGIKYIGCVSLKPTSLSNTALDDGPIFTTKDKTEAPPDGLGDSNLLSFDPFPSREASADVGKMPLCSHLIQGTVVDKIGAIDPEVKIIPSESAASNIQVHPKEAHQEKAERSGQFEAKRGAKKEQKATEPMKGYMRPTKSRGLGSLLPKSPIHDAGQARDRSTSRQRTEKVNLEASSSAEAIAGSITAPPSKELPPSPEKKVKPSAATAAVKPTPAKGRPASTSSPKQSTPPPGKIITSPAPVASSTPKRPASSTARPSNFTPKDSNTPRSSTLTPKDSNTPRSSNLTSKEMKPKGLDLKNAIKSPEKRTLVSKPPPTTGTPRSAVKPTAAVPKMVPAVAVASTTTKRPTSIKTDTKPVEAKKTTVTTKADLSRPKTAPVNSGKSNATTPSSPGTNSGPGIPINRVKPSKSAMTRPATESSATTDNKKLPGAKAPVSKTNLAPKTARPTTVPAPDLKNIRSKIGSTDNLKHQPGGGRAKVEKRAEPVGALRKPTAPLPVNRTAATKSTVSKETAQKDTNGRVQILSKKVNYSHVQSKCGSKDNIKHVPGGGNVAKPAPSCRVPPSNAPKPRPVSANVQILNKKVDTSKVASKCGSKVNVKHKPGGGDFKIENHKSNPNDKVQAKVGSLDNLGHVPAGGKVKIETHKLKFRENAKARTDHGADIVFQSPNRSSSTSPWRSTSASESLSTDASSPLQPSHSALPDAASATYPLQGL
ncbi:microtubule-associated protein 4 isoform X6 [Ambystoma mexicanum]|uniref:microtubule-associated protein 4 isoform X6 n=1 Tax=Ambystoma mexicanum TaxID=8296 RepID=UPI0037E91C6E